MIGNEAWLALTQDAPLDTDLPICDAHHHFWKAPGREYLLEELRQDITSGHNIVSTVFIESDSVDLRDSPEQIQPLLETQFAHDLAEQYGREHSAAARVAAGIIGFADLTRGAQVAALLSQHLAASNRFRGIRQTATWDRDDGIFSTSIPHLLTSPQFRKGFACLHQYNLVFETLVFHPQLMELADLAKAFPETTIILDHAGVPLGIGAYAARKDEVLMVWKEGMLALAACPNVVVKLGGFGMPLTGFGWSERPAPVGSLELAEILSPYFLPCIEQFGTSRCMFESNFPVDRMAYSYTVIWNAFKRLTQKFTQSERHALFHDTAARVYRL